jgi:hypothetical protein
MLNPHRAPQRYGPVAVVAGASEGIGAAFAPAGAAGIIHPAARRLTHSMRRQRVARGSRCRCPHCPATSEGHGGSRIEEACRGGGGLLVYNAASSVGRFLDTPSNPTCASR